MRYGQRSVASVSETVVLTEADGACAALIQEMRDRAGMTVPQLASALGVSVGAVQQYLYRARGVGGSSTLRWFLRLAAVCACEVTITFPARRAGRPAVGLRGRV
jgi:transcriptional regulator with XRE-family HTH domain